MIGVRRSQTFVTFLHMHDAHARSDRPALVASMGRTRVWRHDFRHTLGQSVSRPCTTCMLANNQHDLSINPVVLSLPKIHSCRHYKRTRSCRLVLPALRRPRALGLPHSVRHDLSCLSGRPWRQHDAHITRGWVRSLRVSFSSRPIV